MARKDNKVVINGVSMNRREPFSAHFQRYWQLYAMLLLPVIYFVIFKYVPMIGNILAFRRYRPGLGPYGTEWAGLRYFERFLGDRAFWQAFSNTLILSLLNLLVNFPIPIIFAVMLNEVRHLRFKKLVQTVSYMPHFISLVVVCGILRNFCASTGIINQIIQFVNPSWTSPNLLGVPEYYRTIHISSSIWQECGWDSIIYLATLSTIDPQLYEAAYIDGASKLKRILHITLPSLMPVITIQLIMRVGRVLSVNYEKILLLYNPLTYETADVISTYMYRYGLLNGKYSMGAAVGVFNSILSILILATVNGIFRRSSETSLW